MTVTVVFKDCFGVSSGLRCLKDQIMLTSPRRKYPMR